LTTLPPIPPFLTDFACNNNQLTTLPDDLPSTLTMFWAYGNPQLEIKYPDMNFNTNSASIIRNNIKYINEINSKTRTTERTRQINTDNILLELYMKRMMHPKRIHKLVGDDDAVDISTTMDAYVETL
jgi:Leucine-rich repeat (LRR) protein